MILVFFIGMFAGGFTAVNVESTQRYTDCKIDHTIDYCKHLNTYEIKESK